jgi:large subunit ribosomal protein L30
MTYAVIRIRGTLNIKPDIKETLKMLRLTRANHCVIVPKTEVFDGMLKKAKDYITWGEVEPETMELLLRERCFLEGGAKLNDAHVKKNSSFKGIKELATAIAEGKVEHREIDWAQPVFRLSSPKKGYTGIKRPVTTGGSLGYRGKEINEIIRRMV